MIVYFDGGCYEYSQDRPKAERTFYSSFGILLHSGQETPVEKFGVHELLYTHLGNHEYIAFLEAFKLIKQQGVDPKLVSYYTDSEDIAYAQMALHKENYSIDIKDRFLSILNKSIDLLGMKNDKQEIIECLLHARFVKVKSHSKIVDNIRVDYLSKQAFKKETPISYNEFLGCCFFKYKSETPTKFNLPFMPDNIKKEIQI